jgi:hypothetical protein
MSMELIEKGFDAYVIQCIFLVFEEVEIDGWCVLYYDVPKIHLCDIVLEFIKD